MSTPIFSKPAKPLLLIADDSVENLQILTELLRDEYRTKVAKNGLKALEILQSDPSIDLILLDVMMPEMDGFQVCEVVKSNAATSGIPVIFLTALSEVADETRGFNVGGADFITKPFNADVVKARIRTHVDLAYEKRFSQQLLRILLPEKVIEDLKISGVYTPERHANTSVMFCDLDGFTTISSRLQPEELIQELTEIFTNFDEISSRQGIMRIKTIGDAYMAVSGIGHEHPSIGATAIVQAGLQFIEFLENRNRVSPIQWTCRVGINTGEIISGLVGKSRFQFDVMGDHVNIASRVESNGKSMEVMVTTSTASFLDDQKFSKESLGEVNLKGRGQMELIKIRLK